MTEVPGKKPQPGHFCDASAHIGGPGEDLWQTCSGGGDESAPRPAEAVTIRGVILGEWAITVHLCPAHAELWDREIGRPAIGLKRVKK